VTMDRGTFVADLFGHGEPGAPLVLMKPVEAVSATLRGPRQARCGDIAVIADQPLVALCGALMAAGRPDSAMQVRDRRGLAICFIQSIHAVALSKSVPEEVETEVPL
jgi:hypothetical protein